MYTVYILANGRHTTFYTGVTNDLARRMAEHRAATPETFVGKYDVRTLVYTEEHGDVKDAIEREKRLKRWHREWKLDLIRKQNPAMRDLWSAEEKAVVTGSPRLVESRRSRGGARDDRGGGRRGGLPRLRLEAPAWAIRERQAGVHSGARFAESGGSRARGRVVGPGHSPTLQCVLQTAS